MDFGQASVVAVEMFDLVCLHLHKIPGLEIFLIVHIVRMFLFCTQIMGQTVCNTTW